MGNKKIQKKTGPTTKKNQKRVEGGSVSKIIGNPSSSSFYFKRKRPKKQLKGNLKSQTASPPRSDSSSDSSGARRRSKSASLSKTQRNDIIVEDEEQTKIKKGKERKKTWEGPMLGGDDQDVALPGRLDSPERPSQVRPLFVPAEPFNDSDDVEDYEDYATRVHHEDSDTSSEGIPNFSKKEKLMYFGIAGGASLVILLICATIAMLAKSSGCKYFTK